MAATPRPRRRRRRRTEHRNQNGGCVMWSRKFWADLAERSIKAALWALLGTLGADATGTLTGVDWLGALNVAGYALAIAVIANILGTKVAGLGAENSASFLPETIDPPAPRRHKPK